MKKLICLTILVFVLFQVRSQEEWTKIHPHSTLTNLIDAHFVNDLEGWVVGVDGLIMYTDDGGYNWDVQHSNDDESFWSVYFINKNEGWVCGWSKVYHTDDGGLTWTQQNTPYCMGDFTDVFFINADTGWVVGTYEIVLRTVDGGNNWGKIQNSVWDGLCFYKVDFVDELNGCAVGGHHYGDFGFIMITNDGGLSWTETTPANCESLEGVDYVNEFIVWACGRDGCALRSWDGGQTWEDEYETGSSSFDDIHFYTATNGIMIDGYRAFLTFDAGETWDSVVYLSSSYYSSFRSLCSWEGSRSFVVGFDGAMCKTMDGGSHWQQMNDIMDGCIFNIGFLNASDGFAITNNTFEGDLMRTYDGGYSWEYDTVLQTSGIYNMFIKGQSCYFLSRDTQMIKTLDGGLNWEWLDLPPNNPLLSGISFVNENVGFLCGKKGKLFKTLNGGNTWEDLSIDTNHRLHSVHFVNESVGFMLDWDDKHVLRTEDGGENWDSTSLVSAIVCEPISMSFYGENVGYITTEEGAIFKTTDAGLTWNVKYGFGHDGSYSRITFVSETEGWYLNSSVRHTTDGGASWSDPVLLDGSTCRAIFFIDETLGWMGGVHCMVAKYDGTVGISQEELELPIGNVFPNPVKDQLTLEFSEELKERTELLIYDIQGKNHMRSIASKGSEKCRLDVSELSPGIYFILLKGVHNSQTIKFVKQ